MALSVSTGALESQSPEPATNADISADNDALEGLVDAEEDEVDAHSVVGVCMGREQMRLTSPTTPAAEKSAAFDRAHTASWGFFDPVAEGDDEELANETSQETRDIEEAQDSENDESQETPETQQTRDGQTSEPFESQAQEVENEEGTQGEGKQSNDTTMQITSESRTGGGSRMKESQPADIVALSEEKSKSTIRNRARTGSGIALSELSIRRFLPNLPNLPNLNIPIMTAYKNNNTDSGPGTPTAGGGEGSSKSASRMGRSNSLFASSKMPWMSNVQGQRTASRDVSPSRKLTRRRSRSPAFRSAGPPAKASGNTSQHVVFANNHPGGDRRSDTAPKPPPTLRRSTSHGSIPQSVMSRVSSLDDDSKWEHIDAQVNTRIRAIRDSISDSLPSIPNINFSALRPDFVLKRGSESGSGGSQFLSSMSLVYGNNSGQSDRSRSHSPNKASLSPKRRSFIHNPTDATTATNGIPTTNSIPPHPPSPQRLTSPRHPSLEAALESLTGDVVLLGGYRGSILRSAEPPHRQLWVPVKVGLNIRKVNMEVGLSDADEDSMEDRIYASGMLTHIGPVDISRRLFKRLRHCRNAKDGRLRVHDYGYDWRLSPHKLSDRLIRFLEGLECNRKRSGGRSRDREGDDDSDSDEVFPRGATVIAHSLGGLITRHAVNQRPELFAGVMYAGVPQHCVNILGPLRNGDEVLLSSRVLTAQVNFSLRTSFALLPESGQCFFDRDTGEQYPVDFFDVECWKRLAFSPCIAPCLPPLAAQGSSNKLGGDGSMTDGKRNIFGSLSDSLPSLNPSSGSAAGPGPGKSPEASMQQHQQQRVLSPSPSPSGASSAVSVLSNSSTVVASSSSSAAGGLNETKLAPPKEPISTAAARARASSFPLPLPHVLSSVIPFPSPVAAAAASSTADAEPKSNSTNGLQTAAVPPATASPLCSIPLPDALAYLERTLARTIEFKKGLAHRPELQQAGRYPPIAVLYSTATPTVYGARVSTRNQLSSNSNGNGLVGSSPGPAGAGLGGSGKDEEERMDKRRRPSLNGTPNLPSSSSSEEEKEEGEELRESRQRQQRLDAGYDAISRADAYDNLAFASGDGVVLARAAMAPPGYVVAPGGRVKTSRGHVGMLADLEAVGRCLLALEREKRRIARAAAAAAGG